MVDNRRGLEKVIDRSTIKKIKGNSIHSLTDKGALKRAASSIKVAGKFREKGFCLAERVKLEVNSPSRIRPFTNFPVDLQAIAERERGSHFLKQIWPGSLSGRIDGNEDVVNRITFVTGNDADGNQGVRGVLQGVLSEYSPEMICR